MSPFFGSHERRAALLANLKAWKGTPFWGGCGHKAKCGIGADCVSFVESVLVELTAIEPILWPKYVVQGGGLTMFELIVESIEKIPNVRPIWMPGQELPIMLEGDFFLRSLGVDFHHMGIFAGSNTVWHSRPGKGVCTANWHDRFALKDLKRIYRTYEI
jgi:hypothetical protein